MRTSLSSFTFLAVAFVLCRPAVSVAVYGQCGGLNYSGETTCDSGSVCTKSNDYYWQCLPGNATPTTPSGGSGTTTVTAPTSTLCGGASRTKFKYFGVNQSGAEFGDNKIPGVLGTDYTWPSPSSVDYFVNQGLNSFRIPFKWERMSPLSQGLTGSFDQTYLNGLKTIVNYITNKGAYAIIEPHNYMRYNGQVVTSTANFKTWWTNFANQFKSNSKVVFDIMNEPHDMDASVVFNLNQAAVDGIRSTGATNQIFVEGTAWTGAWSWVSSGNAQYFAAINDPLNNTAIEMHQYLDSDSSGTSGTCVSSTVGAERLQVATDWLKSKGLQGYLGEMGAGSNSQCITAIQGALCTMQTSGVWIGFAWWAAGPWWGNYFTSIEPPSGSAINQILPQALKPYL